MFTTIFVVLWILNFRDISTLPQKENFTRTINKSTVTQYPLNTEVKFLPFKPTGVDTSRTEQKTQHPFHELIFFNSEKLDEALFPFNDSPIKDLISFVEKINASSKTTSEFKNLLTADAIIVLPPNLDVQVATATVDDNFEIANLLKSKHLSSGSTNIILPSQNLKLNNENQIENFQFTNGNAAQVKTDDFAPLSNNFFKSKNVNADLLNSSDKILQFPVLNQPLVKTGTTEHSPKLDVEVFKSIATEGVAQDIPPLPPAIPNYPPVFYPGFESEQFPSYFPENPSFVPELLPESLSNPPAATRRQIQETVRPTEETTNRILKTTSFVPKNTSGFPKNSSVFPKSTPSAHTPHYTSNAPVYPPTSEISKVPSSIWSSYETRPDVNVILQKITPRPVTPYMAKIISATSTFSTPALETTGKPSEIDSKYKLAVVSDYRNYNSKDGTFGFSIDLENGLTARVNGYVKDNKHVIEGSYSLFTNDGEPVNVSYVADNDEFAITDIPTTDNFLLTTTESN